MTAPDPQLKDAWYPRTTPGGFQPLHVHQVKNRFSKFAFHVHTTCAAATRCVSFWGSRPRATARARRAGCTSLSPRSCGSRGLPRDPPWMQPLQPIQPAGAACWWVLCQFIAGNFLAGKLLQPIQPIQPLPLFLSLPRPPWTSPRTRRGPRCALTPSVP